ncbi:MAG: CDP-diacylglycerol--serine O-phosphatidyltransferase [Bacteroidia bacterium]|jgi:CDP-diacylglycerol--serine O-phosphatidyltransferase|nr:CDP-diacylglycerol--serine O-phosphatidyltransferase [Bacteroidia bacterium]
MKLFTIPNLFTLGNLLCGCLAIIFALDGDLTWSAYLVGIAAVLDFLDGFMARLLKSSSPIGKELDSLADCVTFGVVPGIMVMVMVQKGLYYSKEGYLFLEQNYWLTYFPLIISLFSALRLAKFNIDTRQSDSFIGVPTPANAMLLSAIPLMAGWDGQPDFMTRYAEVAPAFIVTPFFLLGISLVMSLLLISELPLFALKFKKFGWKGNEVRYSFLLACLALIAWLGYAGIALSIVAYILLSVVLWMMGRGKQENA